VNIIKSNYRLLSITALKYKINLMEIEAPSSQFQTTADRLGLIFRTKQELYYFLAVECIFQIFVIAGFK